MTKKVALLQDMARLLKRYTPRELNDALSSVTKRESKSRASSKTRTAPKRGKKVGVAKAPRSPKPRSQMRAKGQVSTVRKGIRRNQAKGPKRTGQVNARTNEEIARKLADVSQSLTRARKSTFEDRNEDYARWFRIISGDSGEAKTSGLAPQPTSTAADKSKESKEAIRQLRIRNLLLSGPFKLNSASPSHSRIITFLPDGVIGVGQTSLVARWRLSEGKLELLDMSGAVQSRFVLSIDGSLMQVTDPTTPSAGAVQLVRIAAKN